MNRPTRWAAAVLLFLVPLAGLTYAYPEWPADAGLDVWNAPSLRAELARGQHRQDELESRRQTTMWRLQMKDDVVRQLLAGQITLREAAVVFRSVNATNPQFVFLMRLKHPIGSEDELQARNVLDAAAGALERDPARGEVLSRLQADLEALRRGGEVTLDE